jgi:hypothetical protein
VEYPFSNDRHLENNTHAVLLQRVIDDKNKSLRETTNMHPEKTAQKFSKTNVSLFFLKSLKLKKVSK